MTVFNNLACRRIPDRFAITQNVNLNKKVSDDLYDQTKGLLHQARIPISTNMATSNTPRGSTHYAYSARVRSHPHTTSTTRLPEVSISRTKIEVLEKMLPGKAVKTAQPTANTMNVIVAGAPIVLK